MAGCELGGFASALQGRSVDSVNSGEAVDDFGAGKSLLTTEVSEWRVDSAAEAVEAISCYLAVAKEVQMCRHVIPPSYYSEVIFDATPTIAPGVATKATVSSFDPVIDIECIGCAGVIVGSSANG